MKLSDKERKEYLLTETVEDAPPSKEEIDAFKRLLNYYRRIHGFMAGHIAEAAEILEKIVNHSDLRILSFTGNIVSTGLRGLLAKAIEKGAFDVIITTTGTIDHDIAKSQKKGYYKGSFELDDIFLREQDIHRLGNILIPQENYGPVIESFVKHLFSEIGKKYTENTVISPHELLWEAGSLVNDENSILRAAFLKKVPIVVPGFYDGSFGTNVFWVSRLKNIKIAVERDQELLEELFFKENLESGALIIGGGISKHHTIWWSQFHGGLEYAIYITTAVEYDGSLSGAHPREAISWGKIRKESRHIVVFADATIVLPIILSKIL